MTRVQVSRPAALSATALIAVLALAGCGGDDDTASTTLPVPTASPATQPSTPPSAAPVATEPTTPVTTEPEFVTDGAMVVVANASTVNGAAGRMSDALAAAGFDMEAATNSTESLGTTKVYYNASVAEAQAVANSVAAALGGGAITVEPLPTPAPLSDPETIGDAAVLVALGEDAADKSLAQLQGGGSTTDTTDSTDSADSTSPSTSAG
ncbi:MAG TPA: LytR C-terminal domain-containing protein [Ilumatobacter sp.]|nr:LytR C-terminal domain-containing protein [Ilumatobacter sp.]